jgi:hypothetical protein
MPSTSTHIEHRSWRRREMLKQLLVQDIGPHLPLDCGVGPINERISQSRPRILVHAAPYFHGGRPDFSDLPGAGDSTVDEKATRYQDALTTTGA